MQFQAPNHSDMVNRLANEEAAGINLSARMARLTVDNLAPAETDPFNESGCRTPTAAKHRITPPDTCPPAPRKRRFLSSEEGLLPGKVEFLEPPELETLFASNRQVMDTEPQ